MQQLSVQEELLNLNTFTYAIGTFFETKASELYNFNPLLKARLRKDDPSIADNELIRNLPPITSYQAPKYPVVLCHGLSGFDKLILIPSIYQLTKMVRATISSNHSDSFLEDDDSNDKALLHVDYWIGIREALEAKGCTVITAKVPSFGSIKERATVLNSFIDSEIGKLKSVADKDEVYNDPDAKTKPFKKQEKVKVNLIAHSMGGLDCRYLITHVPNKNYEVTSLTTISTPHRGSEMADYVVDLFNDISQTFDITSKQRLLPPAFYQLTSHYCKYFNEVTPDDPKVSYFSYGACFKPRWYNMFYMSWSIINNLSNGEPNDGMVSVKSAKWGRYMGTLENVDHSDLINWKNKLQKEFEFHIKGAFKKPQNRDIDILHFYLQITDNLARLGF